ncbi:MAG: carbohydrate ABC transporter substrate-binding protein [Spirochaetaceae bacterium]|nr:MAG: carbohydrate ABC transporter substrate-binding protein [Spirochaetaceae bacterium]
MKTQSRWIGFIAIGMLVLMTVAPAFGAGRPETTATEQVTLRYSWWGGESRHNAFLDVLDMFMEEHPHIRVEAEYGGFSGYRDRLSAQMAANNQPDVFMSGHLPPWDILPWDARKDLSQFDLDLSYYDDTLMATFYAPDGFLIGVPQAGGVGGSYLINATLLDELGLELPSMFWTWDDFAELAQSVYDASGGTVYGALDEAGGVPYANAGPPHFDISYHNTTITNENGLALTADQLRFTYEWWGRLRESGAVSPADITAQADDGANSPIVNRDVAMLPIAMGSFSRFQDNTPDTLVLFPAPAGPNEPFTFGPGMSYQISAHTAHPQEAALLIAFLTNRRETGIRMGTEVGVPASGMYRDLLIEQGLSEAEEAMFELQNWIIANRDVRGDITVHARYNEFRDLVRAEQQAMAFGRQTIDQTVDAVVRHARNLGMNVR